MDYETSERTHGKILTQFTSENRAKENLKSSTNIVNGCVCNAYIFQSLYNLNYLFIGKIDRNSLFENGLVVPASPFK